MRMVRLASKADLMRASALALASASRAAASSACFCFSCSVSKDLSAQDRADRNALQSRVI